MPDSLPSQPRRPSDSHGQILVQLSRLSTADRTRLTGLDGKVSLYGDKMGVAHCPAESVEASLRRLEVSNLCITCQTCGWTASRMPDRHVCCALQWGWNGREVKGERQRLFPRLRVKVLVEDRSYGRLVANRLRSCRQSNWTTCRPVSAAMTVPVNGAVHCPAMWRPASPGRARNGLVRMLSTVMYEPSGDACQLPV